MESIPWGILTHGCTGQVVGGFLLAGIYQTQGIHGGNGSNLYDLIYSTKGQRGEIGKQTKIRFKLIVNKKE